MTTPGAYPDVSMLEDAELDEFQFPSLEGYESYPRTAEEVKEGVTKNPALVAYQLFTVSMGLQKKCDEYKILAEELQQQLDNVEKKLTHRWQREVEKHREKIKQLEYQSDLQKELLQQRQASASRTGSTRESTPGQADKKKRSAKLPDTKPLSDGKEPTFKIWSKLMKNKLRENADWFANDNVALEKQAKLAHILT